MFDDLFATLNSWFDHENHHSWQESDTDSAIVDHVLHSDTEPLAWRSSPFDIFHDQSIADHFNGLGNPIADAAYWQEQQEQTSCAVVAQAGVYEAITGQDLSEADACRIAEANGWFDPDKGTSPDNIGKLLAALGIPTQKTYDATLEDIAVALEQGDKVIVGLDAQEIWHPLHDLVTGAPIEQAPAGHAVWVTGIEQADDGSVKLILNDSGTPDGRMKAVDARDFVNAWQDFGNLMVVADAPHPVTVA